MNITVEAMKNDLGSVLLVANDTAHDVKIITSILPELSNKVVELHSTLPGIANDVEMLVKLTVIHSLLPLYYR